MKKLIYLMVAIVILGLIVSGCIPSVVPPAEQDELGTLPNKNPDVLIVPDDYASIQDAVNAADPGDKIVVKAGVYKESVLITTDWITLEGEAGAVLDGTGLSGHGISLHADWVTIEGLEICNYTGGARSSGIEAWDGGNFNTITNCKIHDNIWNAILIGNEGTSENKGWIITDNEIYGNVAYSLELTNGTDCVISGNTVSGGDVGILIQARNTIEASGTVISSNIMVTGNDVSGADTGIYVFAYAGTPLPPFDPIEGAFTILRNVKVSNNNVYDNTYFGIYLWGWEAGSLPGRIKNSMVTDNSVSGSGYHGIVLNDVEGSEMLKNAAFENGYDGIALYGGSVNNKVVKNTANNNDRYGISVRGESSDNKIIGNTALDNVTFDLHWDGIGTGNIWKANKYGTASF